MPVLKTDNDILLALTIEQRSHKDYKYATAVKGWPSTFTQNTATATDGDEELPIHGSTVYRVHPQDN